MLNKKAFQEMRTAMDQFDKQREQLIIARVGRYKMPAGPDRRPARRALPARRLRPVRVQIGPQFRR